MGSGPATERIWPALAIARIAAIVLLAAPSAIAAAPTGAAPIDRAYSELEAAYPRTAYIGGGFSAFFGGLSLSQGIDILASKQTKRDARRAGRALIAVGSVRIVDGLYRLLAEAPALDLASKFRSGRLADPVLALREHGRAARTARFWRAHLILVTGLIYLYLADTFEAYRDEVGAGAFLVGLAAFRYVRSSPDERAAGLATNMGGQAAPRLGLLLLPGRALATVEVRLDWQ